LWGRGIETRTLKIGEGPPELQTLYKKWQSDINDIPHPEYFAKHVSLFFIYQDIRYKHESFEFDTIYDAHFEALLWTVVIKDLIELGISRDDIHKTGSLD
jgi:hypothetical protein